MNAVYIWLMFSFVADLRHDLNGQSWLSLEGNKQSKWILRFALARSPANMRDSNNNNNNNKDEQQQQQQGADSLLIFARSETAARTMAAVSYSNITSNGLDH